MGMGAGDAEPCPGTGVSGVGPGGEGVEGVGSGFEIQ